MRYTLRVASDRSRSVSEPVYRMPGDTASATPVFDDLAGEPDDGEELASGRGRGGARRARRARRVLAGAGTVAAAGLVLLALVAPDDSRLLQPATFARLPGEALLGAGLLVVLPDRARRVVAGLLGGLLGLLALLKVLDLGFSSSLSRPFDPIADWVLVRDGIEFASAAVGHVGVTGLEVVAAAVAALVPVLMVLSGLRLAGVLARHRTATLPTLGVLGVGWIAGALLGAQIVPAVPVGDNNTSALAVNLAHRARQGVRDRDEFAAEVATDTFRDTPGSQLLTGLRGKDVVLTFVESYGRVAVDDPVIGPGVDRVLATGDRQLRAAGFSARSGWLTSATYGGGSWLGHSTLLSGVWVKNQARYRTLVAGDRLTLTGAFRRAGWRTVDVAPGVTRDWPEGKYYGYDRIYAEKDLPYRGSAFSWATMPDQYTLEQFQRLEHGRTDRGPEMAQLTLVSSHAPWTPLPKLVDWDALGDGSVFTSTARTGDSPATVWRDRGRVRAQYAASIEYSMQSLVQFVQRYGDDDLVLVFLGDHQPAPIVSGQGAGHDVPITIVARDPRVLQRIAGWHWADGLRPTATTPVWPMSDFRDRFLTAFG